MKIRMTSNLFHGGRVHGVKIPGPGKVIDLPEDGALEVIAAGHGEAVEDEPEPEPVVEPEPVTEPEPKPDDKPVAATPKPRGRPPKAKG